MSKIYVTLGELCAYKGDVMPKAADQAYLIIREAILNGKLKEAEKIVEEDLVELCQVSRTPSAMH